MWWRVYCKGCRGEYLVHDSLDLELTCMRLGCDELVMKVEQVSKEVASLELKKPYDYEKLNNIDKEENIMEENENSVKISEYSQYVALLENRIQSLSKENDKLQKQLETERTIQENNKRLTELWARGEVEN